MKLKGSITIFMSLTLLILISIFTTILERARILSAKAEIETAGYTAQRALAGYYNNGLWETYDILGLFMDNSREEIFKNYLNDNVNSDKNKLFNVHFSDLSLLPECLNSNGGAEFVRQASECMKNRIPASLIDKIKGGDADEVDNREDISDDSYEDDIDENERKKIKDPREAIKDIESDDGFSKFVMGDEYSDKVLDNKANIVGDISDIGILDKILFNEYLLSHFTSIVNGSESKNKLDYEIEYIIKGCKKDSDNVKKVLRDIKLIRLPINIAFLMKDKVYHNIARIAAIVISGLSFNINAIRATKMAIITAWAYAESAIDVKALIKGKKVPLIKNRDNWNLGFDAILHFWNIEPKDSDKGMSYDDFLRGFLMLKSTKTKATRGIDLIEANLDIKFDNIAYKFNTKFNYKIDRKFLNPLSLDNEIYKNEFVAAYGYK